MIMSAIILVVCPRIHILCILATHGLFYRSINCQHNMMGSPGLIFDNFLPCLLIQSG